MVVILKMKYMIETALSNKNKWLKVDRKIFNANGVTINNMLHLLATEYIFKCVVMFLMAVSSFRRSVYCYCFNYYFMDV